MAFKEHDCIVLMGDIPEAGLRKDDIGTIINLYKPTAFMVEFVLDDGTPAALVDLDAGKVRPLEETDRTIHRVRDSALNEKMPHWPFL